MKLKLKNFRCHLEKNFDFGEEGLVLISGHSGCGKSTIMMAIIFALYGNGTKITTFGKTNCEVELEYENLKIKRTKKPNRLTVTYIDTGIIHEDDIAQTIINDRFGNAFDTTSYVSQNVVNSFIVMSPVDKLAFLEKFAFNGVDLSQIKSRCQSIIKKRNEELISISSQLQMATEFFKNMTKPRKIIFPIKTTDIEKTIQNEKIRLSNTKTLLKRNLKELSGATTELADTKLYITHISLKKQTEETLNERLLKYQKERDSIDFIGDEKLKDMELSLSQFLKRREYYSLKENLQDNEKKLAEIKKNEDDAREAELEKIKNTIWKDYSREEVEDTIKDYKDYKNDYERMESLKQQIDEIKIDVNKLEYDKKTLEKYKSDIDTQTILLKRIEDSEKEYDCPSCGEILKFENNKLILSHGTYVDIETTSEECKKKLNNLEKIVKKLQYSIIDDENSLKRKSTLENDLKNIKDSYDCELPEEKEIDSSLEYFKEYKRTQLELEKRKQYLQEAKNYSTTYEMFKAQIDKDRQKIHNIEKTFINVDSNIDEETLRNQIIRAKSDSEKIQYLNLEIKKTGEELRILRDEIQCLTNEFNKKYNNCRSISDIEKNIENLTEKRRQLEGKESKHENNMISIEKFIKYKEEFKVYSDWNKKVKNLTLDEEKTRKKYAAALQLKDKILEAESLAIQNIVNSINLHAQEYLDLFFPNEPIVVRLSTFKVSKKNLNKPQINLEIDYKGNESDIGSLSGGELARVVLSFTLALSEIFNSPIIMLDESTASLDQEMTSIVMEGIRKNFSNKLVLVIAHQVVSGEFDRQISLSS